MREQTTRSQKGQGTHSRIRVAVAPTESHTRSYLLSGKDADSAHPPHGRRIRFNISPRFSTEGVPSIPPRNLEMADSQPRRDRESRSAIAQNQATAFRLPHRLLSARRESEHIQTDDSHDATKVQPPTSPSHTDGAARSEMSNIQGMQSHDLSMLDMHRQKSHPSNEQQTDQLVEISQSPSSPLSSIASRTTPFSGVSIDDLTRITQGKATQPSDVPIKQEREENPEPSSNTPSEPYHRPPGRPATWTPHQWSQWLTQDPSPWPPQNKEGPRWTREQYRRLKAHLEAEELKNVTAILRYNQPSKLCALPSLNGRPLPAHKDDVGIDASEVRGIVRDLKGGSLSEVEVLSDLRAMEGKHWRSSARRLG